MSIGQIFLGKYRIEEILGHGGMGVVARCTHLALNEQVAIKMLRRDVLSDRDAVERFMREAQAAVKLRSEYVARVSDVGNENGIPYMVMEFLDGHDLGALLDEQNHLSAPWAVELMLQAAEALAEAHSIGIVHRDVKPTNLFVTWRPDGTSLIKVLDFGISKAPTGTDMQLTQTQSLLGTPAYMSPEQMRSARLVDARSDIWSLGTVLYELLEGRRPFEAESFSEMCVKVAVDPPSPMVNTPPALQPVLLRCLAKSPEQRFANMAELGRDLIPFARDPHGATMLVERMTRMLGRRSAADWDIGSSPSNQVRSGATPIPRADRSSPARVPSPAWNDASSRTPIPQAMQSVDSAVTHRERSAPARAPSELDVRRGKLLWLLLPAVALGVAIAIVLAMNTGGDEETPAASPAAGTVKLEATTDTTTTGTVKPVEGTAPATTDQPAVETTDKPATDKPNTEVATDKPATDKPIDKSIDKSIEKKTPKPPRGTPKVPKTPKTAPKETPKETPVIKPPDTPPKADPFGAPRPPRPAKP